ncbi:type II toxin-antitoxin system HicA family toxin [Paucilactobacillus nenjiangensis]|uniref:type II toxin-antitoxin system HicA family toxin n=1 Tax=Paucilactobacillus nenjiangensis TaxID=1296540 RepID=UPI003BB0E090
MPMKPAKMIRKLIKAGFIEVSKEGGHKKFVHPDGRETEVPMHSKELRKGTQDAILKQAGLK